MVVVAVVVADVVIMAVAVMPGVAMPAVAVAKPMVRAEVAAMDGRNRIVLTRPGGSHCGPTAMRALVGAVPVVVALVGPVITVVKAAPITAVARKKVRAPPMCRVLTWQTQENL